MTDTSNIQAEEPKQSVNFIHAIIDFVNCINS